MKRLILGLALGAVALTTVPQVARADDDWKFERQRRRAQIEALRERNREVWEANRKADAEYLEEQREYYQELNEKQRELDAKQQELNEYYYRSPYKSYPPPRVYERRYYDDYTPYVPGKGVRIDDSGLRIQTDRFGLNVWW